MKKFTILLLNLFLLFSCWTQTENKEADEQEKIIENSWSVVSEKEEWVIENTVNIIDDYYTETLPWSIQDARNVVDEINKRNSDMYKELR
jgi:protein involved in sex pheromone biosynthesis